MRRAKTGDMVTVHYIGTLDNGRIFDQRDMDQPLTLRLALERCSPALKVRLSVWPWVRLKTSVCWQKMHMA